MTKLKNMLLSFLAIVVLAFIVTGTTILYSPVHEVSADSKHIHDGVEFQPWNSSNNLPYYSGFYYLTRDVSISEPWTPSIQVRLCLNGYKIYGPAYSLLSTDYTFKVKDATLYLYYEEGGAVLPNRSNPAKCSVNIAIKRSKDPRIAL